MNQAETNQATVQGVIEVKCANEIRLKTLMKVRGTRLLRRIRHCGNNAESNSGELASLRFTNTLISGAPAAIMAIVVSASSMHFPATNGRSPADSSRVSCSCIPCSSFPAAAG